jgi:hypothetical protein
VLLAPAGGLMATHMPPASQLRAALLRPLPRRARAVVMHGTRDDVVPHTHSHALVAGWCVPFVALRVLMWRHVGDLTRAHA